MSDLKEAISESTKSAMRARDKRRVGVLRLVNADIKRVEVDERRELTDADIQAILARMVKQRLDSQQQFDKAGRKDLADQEAFEIELIREFLPELMSDDDLAVFVDKIIAELGAAGMQDMGRVMATLKDRAQGRADMGRASGLVKARLD